MNNIDKFMNGIYKSIQWIILVLSMVAYLFLKTLEASGDITKVAQDWKTWVDIVFSVYITILLINIGEQKGTADGLDHISYKTANEVNNKIIVKSKNKIKELGIYVREKAVADKENAKIEYLTLLNKDEEELTKKEQKELKKIIKAVKVITLKGFNNPIYVESNNNKGNTVSFDVSYNTTKHRNRKIVKKVLQALILSSVSVGVKVAFNNFGDAFFQLLTVGAGATISMFLSLYQPYTYFTKRIPAKVDAKATEWLAFVEWESSNNIKDNDNITNIIVEDEIKQEDEKVIKLDDLIKKEEERA